MGINRDFKGVWIPKEIWLTKELSLIEKMFLVEIDSLDNDEGCFASNKHFALFFDLSKGRVSQIISSLSEKGFIKIQYQREGKEIKRRTIRVVNKLNTPIKFSKGGYLENAKESNTLLSNTSNNTMSTKRGIPYKEIVEYLNEQAGRKYKHTAKQTRKLIKARVNEGFSEDDFYKVIDLKVREWSNDKKMNQYLRPETLFNNKFDRYLNEALAKQPNVTNVKPNTDWKEARYK